MQDIGRENVVLFMMSNEDSSYNSNVAHPERQYSADDLSQDDIEWKVNKMMKLPEV